MAYYSGFSSNPYQSYSSSGRTQGSLLQIVMRKLVDSFDDEERRQHYDEIKADLHVAEENMDDLVKNHQEKLHSTLATFGKIDMTIKECQTKVRMLKDNLSRSKTQLHCKREALKRLYFDEVKYRKMLSMLDKIDKMKHVPEQLQQYRNEKKYYEATELLMNSVSILDGELSKIEALRDLRAELKQLKDGFHEELIEEVQYELYNNTYQVTPHQVTRFRAHSRTPSDVSARSSPLPSKKPSKYGRSSKTGSTLETTLQTPPPIIEFVPEDGGDEAPPIIEEPPISLPYLGTLVESLSMLKKVPQMLDAIQRRMMQELVLIVEKASIRVIQMAKDGGVSEPLGKSKHLNYLKDLLDISFKRFDDVVTTHVVLLNYLKKNKQTYRDNYDLYDESEVWTAIQQVLRDLLEIYLAVDEDKPQTSMSAFSPFTISSHGGDFLFIKKKLPTKARKQPLFRFDNSRHAISVSSYIKEQRDKELVSQVQTGQLSAKMDHHFDEGQPSMSQHIVCKPSIRNITVMYSPVKEFILKIEDALNQPAGFHCDLYQFLLELVEHKFLDSIQVEYQEQLANSTKPEAKLAITVDLKLLRGTNKPALFSSAMLLVDILKKLQQLITDMPMYSANFLSLMLELLQKYIETCSNTFKDYSSVAGAQSQTSDKVASLKLPTISSKWAQSDDIIHLVTDLPSWQSSSKRKPTHVGLGKNSVYEKESNTLLFKLSPEIKQRSDIVHSPENLKYLSILHESTDWLYNKLVEIKDHLQGEWIEGIDGATFSKRASKRNSNSEQQAILDNERQTIELINQFTNCLGELQSISQTAIIMLHLEIRCHCFYYLTPALNQSSYVCEHEVADVESGVKELGNDLRDLKLVTAGVLSLDKQNYLFDGLGHLIATVFINSTSYLKKININGVKKMCRNIQHIQSCLSKITSIREKDLDLAQKYFAMLYVNEEEFLKLVMEQGKVFDQKDYINALKLLSNSSNAQPQSQVNIVRLDNNIRKLEQMFAEDAC